jgi:uncharacterized membrane protein YraQ (UPF0718 family)
MDFILNLIVETAEQVWLTFLHNWPYLVLSVVLAALLKLYLDPKRVSAFLMRHQKAGVVGATALAVTTPLCSCGTTAIVLGMMANLMPWAPIVAFMVSSPLTSPEGLIYSAGLFGWPFALSFFAASIFLGLAGGVLAGLCERRGWLANQTRQSLAPTEVETARAQPARISGPALGVRRPAFVPTSALILEPACCGAEAALSAGFLPLEAAGCACEAAATAQPLTLSSPACGCSGQPVPAPAAATSCACAAARAAEVEDKPKRVTLRMFLGETVQIGQRLLVMFLGFAFIGYFLNGLIPAAWITAIFGSGNAFSVPLAATLGLPFYINSEASLPLVRAMLEAGMSQGAAMAFLIAGSGTSIGAVAGMLTIARWRVVGLVVGTLWAGAIITGIFYNLVF